jgi:two-component system, NarL family, sensor kinase
MKNKTFQFAITILLMFLLNVLNAQKSIKVDALIDNFAQTLSSKPDSALYYISQATQQSKKLNDSSLISRCYYNLGYYYYIQKDLVRSKYYTDLSFPFALQSKNNKILALNYNQLGLIYRDKSNYNKSLQNFLQSLKISEKNQLNKNVSIVLLNLGYLYELQTDTIKALEYYNKSQEIAFKNDLKFELLASYNNLAILQFKTNKEQSIENYNKAYAIAVELNDKYQQFNILINLSDIYSVYKGKKLINNSFKYLEKAKKIAYELSDETLMFYVYFNLGGCYKNTKKFDLAIENYTKANQLSKKGISDEQKLNLLKAFELTYRDSENFNKAYHYKVLHNNLKDSLFSIEKNKVFNEIQTKYEVEKKNLKIDLLSKEKLIERNKKRLMLYISVALFFSLFLVFLFFRQRIKTQKLILEKEHLIHEQETERMQQEQELKWIKGVVEGQDQERNRVAKEIHDGIGGALAGIKLELAQYNSELKSKKIDSVVAKMSKAFGDLRLISHNLSLNSLKDKNLESLFIDLKNDYEQRGEFQVEIVVFPPDSINRIKEVVKHQVYRVIQELLNNISKHAKAKTVFLNFTKHDDFFNIIVEDDGCGFDSEAKKGIGLNNIAERLSVIDAVFKIESSTRGTTITIDIPISQI